MSRVRKWCMLCGISAATVLALLPLLPQAGLAAGLTGDVYVATNQSIGNSIMIFHRNTDGTLVFLDSVASGGKGAGAGADPLGSQGSLVLSEDNRLLFAVNAGSGSISVFAVSGDGLTLLGTVPSGGTFPVSLAVRNNLLYALNAGMTPNISGFIINSSTNQLVPLAGSTRTLPGGVSAAPAQVSFSQDGSVLVVTEKGTDRVDTFTLDDKGGAQPGVAFSFNGITPFGLAFGPDNILVVSDAGGNPGTSAVSSYSVDNDGTVTVVTPALGDGQTAACWLVLSTNSRFAFAANAGSGTLSSYMVSDGGNLELLNVAAASTGGTSTPTDMALSNTGQFLYVRNGGNGTISGFHVESDGNLTPLSVIGGLPDGSQGIAAR